MKILLIGEFSGFHLNLKDGLEKSGHVVTLASYGDSYKDYKRDIDFTYPNQYRIINKIVKHIYPIKKVYKLKNYDIVQFINPMIFSSKYGINQHLIEKLLLNNDKTFLVATGTDPIFWHYGKQLLKYNPLDYWKEIDRKGSLLNVETEKALKWNIYLANKVNGIIPSMLEYRIGYKEFPNLMNIIPLPYNFQDYPEPSQLTGNKIKVFHGISRFGYKGSEHIIKDMERIKLKYPNDFNIKIEQKLSYNKYVQEVKNADVLIDQLYSHSWGYNAILGMALGKIVLSGAEPESLEAFGISKAPIFNINNGDANVFNVLEKILEQKNKISSFGYDSYRFAKGFHDCESVAKAFLNAWKI
jgi:hypothetical protein